MSWLNEGQSIDSHLSASDFEIELLLRRTPTISDKFTDLEIFIGAMSKRATPPQDSAFMGVALAATARAAHPSARLRPRRVTVLAASLAVLLALSGVAMAADHASPGDLLYRLDRALEQIGIGAGGVDERITEFDVLMADGADERAFELLEEFADSAPEADASKAEHHLDLAAGKQNENAAATQEKVAVQQEFIDGNQGQDVGTDGKDFGQGVADTSNPDANDPASDASEGTTNGKSAAPPGQSSSASDDVSPGGSGGQGNTGTSDVDRSPGSKSNSDKSDS